MAEITIVIPTFRRPELVARAIRSCRAQEDVRLDRFEIVVVDNCPDASAHQCVIRMMAEPGPDLRYVHEPQSGISHARNAGLDTAAGRFAVFLDDDEEASRGWLYHLLKTQYEWDADVVLAPVLPRLEPVRGSDMGDFVENFFTYCAGRPSGTEIGSGAITPFWSRGKHAYPRLASGNALLRLAAIGRLRFDPRLGRTGGEDTLFFNQLLAEGRRIVWCAEAVAIEDVPEARQTLDYILPRAFRGGQITSRTPILLRRKRPLMTMLSMAVGAVQLPIAMLRAGVAHWRGRPDRYRHFAAAATACGKIFWMKPFRRAVYGTAGPQDGSGLPALTTRLST